MLVLGEAFRSGENIDQTVPPDMTADWGQAYMWFSIAALEAEEQMLSDDEQRARDALESLRGLMTSHEIDRAAAAAGRCKLSGYKDCDGENMFSWLGRLFGQN